MNCNDGIVASNVVNDLVKNAEFMVLVVILCPLKVGGQTWIAKLLLMTLLVIRILYRLVVRPRNFSW